MPLPTRLSIGLSAALGLAIVACGGGQGPAPTPAPTPTPTAPSKITITGETDTATGLVVPDGSTDAHQSPATDFGVVGSQIGDVVGRHVERTYQIMNVGTGPLPITGVTLTGSGAEQFVLTERPDTAPLSVRGTTRFQLSWRPFPKAVLGDNTARVQVTYPGGTFTFTVVGRMSDTSDHH